MDQVDDFPALRAAAGDTRSARNLRHIGELCLASSIRAAAYARRLSFMERVLTAPCSKEAPVVDWLSAWAMAHMTLHPAVGRVDIDAPKSILLGARTPAVLQLLDAALVAAARGCSPSAVTAKLMVRETCGGVSIRMDCSSVELDADDGASVIAMATSAGLPAAWRLDGDRASIGMLLDVVGKVRDRTRAE